MMLIKSIELNGYVIELHTDENASNPREDYNFGEILYTTNRYVLGDRHVNQEEIAEICRDKNVFWLPVYAYIHSGIALNTTGFGCPWDSGQCGIIYVEKQKVREWFDCDDFNGLEEEAENFLKGEIDTYCKYVNGEVYGYVVKDPNGNEIDSCWGYYDEDYCIDNAKTSIPKMSA